MFSSLPKQFSFPELSFCARHSSSVCSVNLRTDVYTVISKEVNQDLSDIQN